MGVIRELPPSVVNQIAAGEVVERPASVVKELLENSLDAGATRIELTIERGGKDLVRIADDGCGIHADDLPLAFRPHATSKLASAEDLHTVSTLGFRGEALAAIAEVSRVRCQTRNRDEQAGSEVEINAGVASEIRECGIAPGTILEVRNLFHNVPVRRAFLKSDTTEASHVTEAFTRAALANPRVHMILRSGNRVVHDVPASAGVKERVAMFFGQELADSLLWVESRIDGIHVRGYVAHPSQSRSSNKNQFLFIGRRYVRDRSLSHALTEAYRNLLMVGRQPVAFLFLDLPPEEVDVNVHPSKIEVRFRDSNRVYSQLLSTIRQTFLKSDLHTRLQSGPDQPDQAQPEPAASPARPPSEAPSLWPERTERQDVANWFKPTQPSDASHAFAPRTAPAPSAPFTPRATVEPEWVRRLPTASEYDTKPNFAEFPTEPPIPASTTNGHAAPEAHRAIQLHDSYLVVETPEGMVVIDQHALHERILFEQLRARIRDHSLESQRLLVPMPVELPAVDVAALSEKRPLLARLGIEVEPLSGGTVLVSALPVMLASASPESLIRDLADHFRETPIDLAPDVLLDHTLSSLACKAAVKAGQRLTGPEIDALVERRHLANDTHHCPHGRPTALVFSKADLERQFGRI